MTASAHTLADHQHQRVSWAERVGIGRPFWPRDEVDRGSCFHVLPDRLLRIRRERQRHALRGICVVQTDKQQDVRRLQKTGLDRTARALDADVRPDARAGNDLSNLPVCRHWR